MTANRSLSMNLEVCFVLKNSDSFVIFKSLIRASHAAFFSVIFTWARTSGAAFHGVKLDSRGLDHSHTLMSCLSADSRGPSLPHTDPEVLSLS